MPGRYPIFQATGGDGLNHREAIDYHEGYLLYMLFSLSDGNSENMLSVRNCSDASKSS